MKRLNVKPQLAIITTIGMVAVLSAIILSQSTILPMHNAYAKKDKSTDTSTDSGKADNTNDCSTSTDNQDNQDNQDNGNGKADNTNDCSTSTDNQDNEENDNGNDKSNDG